MATVVVSWLIPAAALTLVGGGAVGRMEGLVGDAGAVHEWIRAVMVLLALFTLLLGAIWAIRTWPARGGRPASEPAHLLTVHGSLAAASIVLATTAQTTGGDDRLWSAAAVAALGAMMVVPRCVARVWSVFSPITALAALVAWEMSVGWLQLLGSSILGSIVIVAEGLALAWCAAAAARVVWSAMPTAEIGVVATIDAAPMPRATEVVAVESGEPDARADAGSAGSEPGVPAPVRSAGLGDLAVG